MKKPEEYLIGAGLLFDKDTIIGLISNAQIDAYNQAIEDAADKCYIITSCAGLEFDMLGTKESILELKKKK